MPRLPAVNPDQTSGETRALLDGVKQKLGVTPNVFRTLANSPVALKAYSDFSRTLGDGRLDSQVREAISLTVAGANRCEYCAAAHAYVSRGLKVDDAEIGARLKGQSSDPKVQAIIYFAKRVVEARGIVSDNDVGAVREAGLDNEEITEVVANVALNLYTNYFNHVAGTEVDFPRTAMPNAA